MKYVRTRVAGHIFQSGSLVARWDTDLELTDAQAVAFQAAADQARVELVVSDTPTPGGGPSVIPDGSAYATRDYVDASHEEAVAALIRADSEIRHALDAGFMRGKHITDFGAVANDRTVDNYAAVQATLDWLDDRGGGVAIIPPDEFAILTEQSLGMGSSTTMLGSGDESALYFAFNDMTRTPQNALFLIVNKHRVLNGGDHDISLRSFTIRGASPGGPLGVPSNPGVTCLFQYADRVSVIDVRFQKTFGPCVHYQGCVETRVINSKVEDCGRGGFMALGRDGRSMYDHLVTGCQIVGVGDDAIACPQTSPNTGLGKRITISGNNIDGVYNVTNNADGGRGILCLGVAGIAITGNVIGECASRMLVIGPHDVTGERCRDVTIGGNVGVHNSPSGTAFTPDGVYIDSVDHLTMGPLALSESSGYGVRILNSTHVTGGPLTIHNCGELIDQGALYLGNCFDVDLWVDAYMNAGPGVVVTNGSRIVLRGRAVDNCNASTARTDSPVSTRNQAAGVLLKTAGEVTLTGFRAYDSRPMPADPPAAAVEPYKKQMYGLATRDASPSRLTLIGGDFTGNTVDPGIFYTSTAVPVVTIKRGVVESTDSKKNYDQDASGVRRYSSPVQPNGQVTAPPGSFCEVADGTLWSKPTAGGTGNTGWVQIGAAVAVDAPIWANLTADVTVNNRDEVAGLIDVLATSGPLAPNTTYELQGSVEFSADTAADVQFGWKAADLPGTVLSAGIIALGTAAAASTGTVSRVRQSLSSTLSLGGIGVGSHIMGELRGKVKTGSTGAVLTLQFAQDTAGATDAVLYAQGTYFKLNKVS